MTQFPSLTSYLSKNNVQMGSTYAVGKKSQSLYNAGYKAAAKYINATPNEIGLFANPDQSSS